MRTHINLPFPPSVNSLYNNRKGGRCKTKRYKEWEANATEMLLRQNRGKHQNQVAVNIFATKPDKRKRDIDNIAKATLDFLVSMGIILDDSLIQILHIEWATRPNGIYVIIEDLHAGNTQKDS